MQIIKIKNGVLQSFEVRTTEYGNIGSTLARGTFDRSGDYC